MPAVLSCVKKSRSFSLRLAPSRPEHGPTLCPANPLRVYCPPISHSAAPGPSATRPQPPPWENPERTAPAKDLLLPRGSPFPWAPPPLPHTAALAPATLAPVSQHPVLTQPIKKPAHCRVHAPAEVHQSKQNRTSRDPNPAPVLGPLLGTGRHAMPTQRPPPDRSPYLPSFPKFLLSWYFNIVLKISLNIVSRERSFHFMSLEEYYRL